MRRGQRVLAVLPRSLQLAPIERRREGSIGPGACTKLELAPLLGCLVRKNREVRRPLAVQDFRKSLGSQAALE